MKKILYIDAFSGISGDMLVAAFINAGMSITFLEENYQKLRLPEGHRLEYKLVMKGSLQAGNFKIHLDHDPAHDHGHAHRHMSDIRILLSESGLTPTVKDKAIKLFEVLAIAEGKVHGKDPEQVHFHEVGATDSILDIVGIALALEYFQIDEVYSSSLPWNEGTVHTQHGAMPLPAPATLVLLTACNAVFRPFESTYELITPTGAAFLAAFAKFEKPSLRLLKQGVGSGSKDLDWPNILRVIMGEEVQSDKIEYVVVETNIDDMNPQNYGYLMERCFAAGAVDVTYEPIFMKKNRPATKVSVIVAKSMEDKIANLLLQETTTFGVRVYPVQRYEAKRDVVAVKTEWGDVRIKRKWMDGSVVHFSPEYEDCKKIADEFGLPLLTVIETVKRQFESQQKQE